jgi:hypothetical protein
VIVELTIDRLVLDGLDLPANSGAAVGVALEAELGRLFTERGLGGLPSNLAVPQLGAAGIRIPQQARATDVGAGIARSVHEGLVR